MRQQWRESIWWARALELYLIVLAEVQQPVTLDIGPVLHPLRRGQMIRLRDGDVIVATLVPQSNGDNGERE